MTNFEHLKLGGPLPDLDTLTPEELKKLADEAREEMSTLGELWLMTSEATVEGLLTIAGIAVLESKRNFCWYHRQELVVRDNPEFEKAHELLTNISSVKEKISFAIAILEGILSDYEEDGDDEEEEGDEEIEEAIKQNNLNKALQLAAESEAIKEEFYAGHPAY